MQTINNEMVVNVRKDIKHAMKPIEEKYNLTFDSKHDFIEQHDEFEMSFMVEFKRNLEQKSPFNKTKVRKDAEKAMKPIEEKYNLTLNSEYDFVEKHNDFKVKFFVEFKSNLTKKDVFEYRAKLFNIDPTFYNKEVYAKEGTQKIVEIQINNGQPMIILQLRNGEKMIYTGAPDELKKRFV